jgi:hypothetical protein
MTHLNAKPETFVAAPVGGGTWALQFETDDGEKYCVLINDVNQKLRNLCDRKKNLYADECRDIILNCLKEAVDGTKTDSRKWFGLVSKTRLIEAERWRPFPIKSEEIKGIFDNPPEGGGR